MTIPTELFIALLSFNGAFLTVCCHLLVVILRGQNSMDRRQSIIEYKLGITPNSEHS